jgi:hypothetical protein
MVLGLDLSIFGLCGRQQILGSKFSIKGKVGKGYQIRYLLNKLSIGTYTPKSGWIIDK